jgi:sigma-E factor negative regulatory protein RseA
MEKMDNDELISALADGQLQGEEFARAVALAADPAGRRTWHAYQAVGEVLRSGRPVHGATEPEAFLERLQVKLRAETLLAAPPLTRPTEASTLTVVARAQAPANDWRWKLVAGVASVAAVAAISWNIVQPVASPVAQPQLAAAPAQPEALPAQAGAQQAAMIRDPRLDQLLAAHRQLGGATAWQSTSGFLRNATFEGQAR